MTDSQAKKVTKVLKLVAGTARVKIIATLAKQGPGSVQEIAHRIGMTHSGTSHQLAVLKGAGVIERRKDGRKASYSVVESRASKALLAAITSI